MTTAFSAADAVTDIVSDSMRAERRRELDGGWDPDLWRVLETQGMTLVGIAEKRGGSGGTMADAAAVIGAAAGHSVSLPLAETQVAAWLLAEAGQPIPSGPLALGVPADGDEIAWSSHGSGDPLVSARLAQVAWARNAEAIVLAGADGGRLRLCTLPRDQVRVSAGHNVAGEPRDRVDVETSQARVDELDAPSVLQIRCRLALFRAVMTAAAARHALTATAQYARERHQFGRPIADFQAIQQQLATTAAETSSAEATNRAAAAAAIDTSQFVLCVASAKVTAGRAARSAFGTAHQIHGALGFTKEHRLHLTTRRLLAWRDEYGTAEHWAATLGRHVIEGGAPALWPTLVDAASSRVP